MLFVLDSFHKNIKFIFKEEKDNKNSFLYVLILRNSSSIETTFYRKLTDNDIYLRWGSFSSNGWKLGTLKTHLMRTFVVCFNEQLLTKETEHSLNVFHHTYGYRKAVVQNIVLKVNEEQYSCGIKQITEMGEAM